MTKSWNPRLSRRQAAESPAIPAADNDERHIGASLLDGAQGPVAELMTQRKGGVGEASLNRPSRFGGEPNKSG